jgi:acetate kinase
MKVLVANLGSTSFKYKLLDMSNEQQIAGGGIERIGEAESQAFVDIGGNRRNMTLAVPDHAEAVRQCLAQLTDSEHGCLSDATEVAAIGFKAVHGGRVSGVQRVDEQLLTAMEEMSQVAPAHNPPYVAAMRQLNERLPDIPLVAAFETGFHATIPERARHFAIPHEWADLLPIRRWGFHGASHRYIATRAAEIVARDDLRLVSCHLGGSSSLCAIRGGQSVATSMGMSPQSGVPHNNRVGDFDPFALPAIMAATGKSLEDVLDDLANRGGLLGLSGLSGDVRDLEKAAESGNERARLALDVFITDIRRYLGGLLVELGGSELIVFTGGIGENGVQIRASVCQQLEQLGITLDADANAAASGECCISSSDSLIQVWVIPTNEELVVARQVRQLLEE